MVAARKKKGGGGGKLSRTETITVRFDPRLRYLADLAARKQRRTTSSFVEWAVEQSINSVELGVEYSPGGHPTSLTVGNLAGKLWDVDETNRFIELAFRFPELMTHDEQRIWAIIRNNGYFWKGHYSDKPPYPWEWATNNPDHLVHDRVREHWELFAMIIAEEDAGEGDSEQYLPTWPKVNPNPPDKPPPDDKDM